MRLEELKKEAAQIVKQLNYMHKNLKTAGSLDSQLINESHLFSLTTRGLMSKLIFELLNDAEAELLSIKTVTKITIKEKGKCDRYVITGPIR